MDKLLQEYLIRKETNYTEYDANDVKFICDNTAHTENELVLDCHGLLREELLYFLEFLDVIGFKMTVKFITGKGNHSKKPKMDYLSSKFWRCPLKQLIVNYYNKTKRGMHVREFPSYVTIKLR